jgi:hypothetical protein
MATADQVLPGSHARVTAAGQNDPSTCGLARTRACRHPYIATIRTPLDVLSCRHECGRPPDAGITYPGGAGIEAAHLLPRWVKSSSACQAAAARPDDHLDGAAGGTSALLSQPDDVAPIMGMLGATAEVTAASRSRFSRQAVIGRLVPVGCQDSAYSCDLGRWARRGCGA